MHYLIAAIIIIVIVVWIIGLIVSLIAAIFNAIATLITGIFTALGTGFASLVSWVYFNRLLTLAIFVGMGALIALFRSKTAYQDVQHKIPPVSQFAISESLSARRTPRSVFLLSILAFASLATYAVWPQARTSINTLFKAPEDTRRLSFSAAQNSSENRSTTTNSGNTRAVTATSSQLPFPFTKEALESGILRLEARTYTFSNSLSLETPITIIGQGVDVSKFVFTGENTFINYEANGTLRLENLSISKQSSQPGNVISVDKGKLELINSFVTGAVSGSHHSGAGLILDFNAQGLVNNSTFSGNTVGIKLLGNATIDVQGTILSHNGTSGIYLDDNSNANISKSTILKNASHGVVVVKKSSANLDGNTVQDNLERGVSYEDQSKGSFTNNMVYRNGYGKNGRDYWQGIGVDDNASPRLLSNTVKENAGVGIQFIDDARGEVSNNQVTNNSLNYDKYRIDFNLDEISSGGLVLGMYAKDYNPQPAVGSNTFSGNIGGGFKRY